VDGVRWRVCLPVAACIAADRTILHDGATADVADADATACDSSSSSIASTASEQCSHAIAEDAAANGDVREE
jgi:hypothetical protein